MAPNPRQSLRRRPSPRAVVAPARRLSPVATSLTGLPGGGTVDAARGSAASAPRPEADTPAMPRRRRLSATAHRRRSRRAAAACSAVDGAGSAGLGSDAGAPRVGLGRAPSPPRRAEAAPAARGRRPLLPRPTASPLVPRARSAAPSPVWSRGGRRASSGRRGPVATPPRRCRDEQRLPRRLGVDAPLLSRPGSQKKKGAKKTPEALFRVLWNITCTGPPKVTIFC